MTYQQFLSRLRKTPRDWRIEGEKILRRKGTGENCPAIQVLFNRGRLTLLSDKSMNAIYLAADTKIGSDPAIRRDLLRACGLKETQ